jgi:hypothetical protein
MRELPIKQYLAAWDVRDVDGMLRTFTDDAVVVPHGRDGRGQRDAGPDCPGGYAKPGSNRRSSEVSRPPLAQRRSFFSTGVLPAGVLA